MQRDVDEFVVDHSCGARGAGPIAVAESTKMHNGTFTLYKVYETAPRFCFVARRIPRPMDG
jgi:hypothetical protein